jgi:amidase
MTVALGSQTWEDKASWTRAQRDASLAKVEPKLDGLPAADSLPLCSQDLPKDILTAREVEITERYNVTELLSLLRERKISVEEVTRAFLRRAAIAQAAVWIV